MRSFLSIVLFVLSGGSVIRAETMPSVVTVFYQGIFNTQAQAAKLVGIEGFVYPYTGETVRASRAIDCIINLRTYPEIEEVELWDLDRSIVSHVVRPITLFWFAARRASNWWNGILVDLPEGTLSTGKSLWTNAVRIRLIGLGQERDIAEHYERVLLCREDHPDAAIVLYGVSRGSLATFNAYVRHKYKGVRALVLESCPDSIAHVVQEAYGSIAHSLYKKGIQYVCEHDPEGISALGCVEQFPHDTPVLFITSKKDCVVPVACTLCLAHALAQTGHPHVYCLVLNNASHDGYVYDDPNDAHMYQSVVHALYKKHAITGCCETYAAKGAELLDICHIIKG